MAEASSGSQLANFLKTRFFMFLVRPLNLVVSRRRTAKIKVSVCYKIYCSCASSCFMRSVEMSSKEILKIGTHNGTFHCDEVLACFMLKQLPEYKNAEVVRSRDRNVLDTCDIVVDVGGVYDPSKYRYDHHQREFQGTMQSLCPGKPWQTRLSSAGLIYLHFGHRIISAILGMVENEPIIYAIYDKIYENFIQEIDAIDNGIMAYDSKPRYAVTTHLSARVHHLNPSWNEKDVDLEEQFEKAIKLVGTEFIQRVNDYAKSWWPARILVEKAIQERLKVDSSGEIIELDDGGYPWKDHLFDLEEKLNLDPTIKFVIFTDTLGKWRVQAVPVFRDSFELRIPLLEEWRGVRDEELEKTSGIPGIIFVHATGFIGGHSHRDGALEMARMTLGKSSLKR